MTSLSRLGSRKSRTWAEPRLQKDLKGLLLTCLVRRHLLEAGEKHRASRVSSTPLAAGDAAIYSLMGTPRSTLEGWTNEDEMNLFVDKTLSSIYALPHKARRAPTGLQAIHDRCRHIVNEDADFVYQHDIEFAASVQRHYKETSGHLHVSTKAIQEELRLEGRVVSDAVNKYRKLKDDMGDMGKASTLRRPQMLFVSWFFPLTQAIEQRQTAIMKYLDADAVAKYTPYLLLLEADAYAVIVMHEVLGQLLSAADGLPFGALAAKVGQAVANEVNYQRLQNHFSKGFRKRYQAREKRMLGSHSMSSRELRMRVQECLSGDATWPRRVQVQLGAALIECLLEAATLLRVKDRLVGPAQADAAGAQQVKAFVHDVVKDNADVTKTVGMVYLSRYARDFFSSNRDTGHVAMMGSLPMVVPPVPWSAPHSGGYLRLPVGVMRTRSSKLQTDVLRQADLSDVYRCLNALAEMPWRVNRELLRVMLQVWEDEKRAGEDPIGKLPGREDALFPADEGGEDWTAAEWAQYRKQVAKAQKTNQGLHSLRCDTQYKIDVAKLFCDKQFYFPYNLDFRGRVYPIPPHLNHLGSDVCRALLAFAEGEPVTDRGIWWLHVHVANLFGNDKVSFADRVQWTKDHLASIRACVRDPLDGDRWWATAEDPWQFLATSQELVRILDSPLPSQAVSSLPVHQDGSCNGLQHYAALGRDKEGGESVNLCPGPKPRDVYSDVLKLVDRRVAADAAENPLAAALQGKLTRKIVKQTVMTSVYGVTLVGSRDQIFRRLVERPDILFPEPEEESIQQASMYLARVSFDCLKDLFGGARAMMDWLNACARQIAKFDQPVSWLTPLGLPVVQPYRAEKMMTVQTSLQSVMVADMNDSLPVHKARQASAFPPNYIHSLDSTHMMMTALKCHEANIPFTAVHDSYWTLPCYTDDMNRILREAFVELHQKPLLEDLRRDLIGRFPDAVIPPVPETGALDLNVVREADYFFN